MKKKELNLKCVCGCGSDLMIGNFGDGQVVIEVRTSGQKEWNGVVVDKDIPKIIEFLKKLYIN